MGYMDIDYWKQSFYGVPLERSSLIRGKNLYKSNLVLLGFKKKHEYLLAAVFKVAMSINQ